MNKLIENINKLKRSDIKDKIEKRLEEFQKLNKKSSKEWFSELCFCLLTANTSAEMGIRVQNQLGYKGFTDYKDEKELVNRLKKARSRFYNRRAHFIHLANKHKSIKTILKKQKDMREWLVENIKGLSYKEASHFLRNVGYFDYAILDKHILKTLHENILIPQIPSSMNKNNYLLFEQILGRLSKRMSMSQGELDLYLWYLKTGKVQK